MAEAENYTAWLLERVARFPARRILDLGAGIGSFTESLSRRAEVVAVEPDPAFAAGLRERFAGREGVTVVEGDVFESSVAGPFETVVCLNVLEHIDDDVGTLSRVFDLLAPGGHLLLLVPAHALLYGEIDRSVGHERRYSKRLLGARLVESGLVVDELRYVNPLGAFGWLVTSRLLRRGQVPRGPLKLYDRLVPLLRAVDRLRLPFGLSVWAVAHRPPAS